MTYKIFKIFHCIGTILVVVLVAAVLCFYVFGDVEWIPFEWLPVELVYKEICDGKPVECLESPDSIHIAAQLGRLDFISISLAILGATVGLAAIFSFMYIKEKASIEAKEAAIETTKTEVKAFFEENIDAIAISIWGMLEKDLSDKVEADSLIFSDSAADEGGDEIAGTYREDQSNE